MWNDKWFEKYFNYCINYIVPAFIRAEPNVINYWLWIGTALGTGFGVLSSAVGAIASVLKSASYSKKHGTVVLLFISNFSSGN